MIDLSTMSSIELSIVKYKKKINLSTILKLVFNMFFRILWLVVLLRVFLIRYTLILKYITYSIDIIYTYYIYNF